jgi:hypothetical protein
VSAGCGEKTKIFGLADVEGGDVVTLAAHVGHGHLGAGESGAYVEPLPPSTSAGFRRSSRPDVTVSSGACTTTGFRPACVICRTARSLEETHIRDRDGAVAVELFLIRRANRPGAPPMMSPSASSHGQTSDRAVPPAS